MACSCKKGKVTFVWLPEDSLDGEGSKTYTTEVQAKAKVMRDGGTYKMVQPGGISVATSSTPTNPVYNTGL